MPRQAQPAKIDVFLSYKREEKASAQLLAEYLTERGFDVWWDAALLAGDDFAAIVHEEVRGSRAVVVLWSRRAVGSHWVDAEASLALAAGTLINAVIDDLPFEEIPEPYRHIQAVRLGDDPQAFFTAIAAAITRKGTTPSQSTQSAAAARTALEEKVGQSEFFLAISQSTDPLDFREYLDRFGETGQFASIALRKIAALEQQAAEQQKLSRRIWLMLGGAATVLTILAGVVALLQFAGMQPIFGSRPQPDPGSTPAVAAPGSPDPAQAAGVDDPATAPDLPAASYATQQFGIPVKAAPGTVHWSTEPYLGGTNVVARASFADPDVDFTVTITDPGSGPSTGDVDLTVEAEVDNGALPPETIFSVAAVGMLADERLTGVFDATRPGTLRYVLDADANRGGGAYSALLGGVAVIIQFELANQQIGALRLDLTPDIRRALRTILYRNSASLLDTAKEIFAPGTAGTDDPRIAEVEAEGLGRFEYYLDTDFYGNDHASGVDNAALQGLSARECQAQCAKDNVCRVFVYNVRFRSCFLKSNWTEQAPFDGALSGVKLPPR